MSRFDPALLERALAYVGRPLPQPPVEQPVETAVLLAAGLCRRFEGFVAAPYLCAAGVPSIGYGATFYLDGRRVALTDAPISRETAERLMLATLRTVYLPAVLKLCPGARTPGQLAALLDFTFNLGPGPLASSTLRRVVNAGAWDQVPAQLRRWVYGGGRRLRGLELRRDAEIALLTGWRELLPA